MAPRAALPLLVLALSCTMASSGAEPDDGADPVLHFFFSPTCVHCHPIQDLLARIQHELPSFVWEAYPLTDPQNIDLMTRFYALYGVPEEEWNGTMAIFVGDKWWVDGDKALAEIKAYVSDPSHIADTAVPPERATEASRPSSDAMTEASSADSGVPPPAPEATSGGGKLREIFERFTIPAIAGAGLLDGVNPCALATLIFLLSYLGLTGRGRGEILAIGLAFAAGVFLAYLAVGMGALRAIEALDQLTLASKLVYPILAALTLTMAVVSFADYRKAAAGNTRAMTLKLPRRLTLTSHGIIRRLLDGRGFVALAFVAGALISILELFCTGQIYLPTLMYMWSVGAARATVFAYLVLYVAMFTTPILLLTGAVYAGAGTATLQRVAREHVGAVKLAIAVLFVVLGAYLTVVSLQVLGVG